VPALSPEQGNVKALIVALFLLTMQLCYTGLLVDTDNLSWGQFLSIFYWVSIMYMLEMRIWMMKYDDDYHSSCHFCERAGRSAYSY
jgi:hypothetical protein